MDEELENEGRTDKQTPSLDEASPRMEKMGQTFTPRNTTGGDFFGPKIVGKPHGKVEKKNKGKKVTRGPKQYRNRQPTAGEKCSTYLPNRNCHE
ncbi:hypothetical protein JTB14_036042 [Gonioctena quinquepunctata]|nr:hypothetical protein JTB14_036042 [Gonioctena quinquepunctata]